MPNNVKGVYWNETINPCINISIIYPGKLKIVYKLIGEDNSVENRQRSSIIKSQKGNLNVKKTDIYSTAYSSLVVI